VIPRRIYLSVIICGLAALLGACSTSTPRLGGEVVRPANAGGLTTPVPAPTKTAAPTAVPPALTVTPTQETQPDGVQLPGFAGDYHERWRYVQRERTPVSDQPGETVTYTAPSKHWLWWYDPIYGQPLALGQFEGPFEVQATFRFRGQIVHGLEVPYEINRTLGIVIPEAILTRMRAAGYDQVVEAFVYQTDDMTPQE
jgi:hypothetical protein